MRLTVVLSFLAGVAAANPFAAQSVNSAKARYTAALLKNARRLNDNAEYNVDISSYAVKFEKCMSTEAYDDDLAADEDSSTVLALKRFVIFRLCPDTSCSTCDSNYGEYMVDLDSYLEATVQWAQQNQQEMCNACNECAVEADDADAAEGEDADAAEGEDAEAAEGEDAEGEDAEAAEGEEAEGEDAEGEDAEGENAEGEDAEGGRRKLATADCSTCAQECEAIANMEANGYVDATSFLECQLIYDPDDDAKTALYAGPVCSSSTKIEIGIFTDEGCYTADASLSIADYVADGVQLSYGLLESVYSGSCISCANEEEDDGNDQANEMCQALYEDAAKCEVTHGMNSGFYDAEGYENQVNQETLVCDFIDAVTYGSFSSPDDIYIYGRTDRSSSSGTSIGQKVALAVFVLGTVGLAIYAVMLHKKITKPKGELVPGGAFA